MLDGNGNEDAFVEVISAPDAGSRNAGAVKSVVSDNNIDKAEKPDISEEIENEPIIQAILDMFDGELLK
jgi:hypothetical protein